MNSRGLTTVSQVLSSLAAIQSQEADISSSLSTLLSSQQPIVNSLEKLHSLLPRLEEASLDVRLMSEKVTVTSETAQRVGASVRTLDEEISRLKESAERVGQVMELSSSLRLLDSAMKANDYDTATRHCARAMVTPQEVTESQFAETVIVNVFFSKRPVVINVN
jgi:conserved oligomeric Golgi complex subunit 4